MCGCVVATREVKDEMEGERVRQDGGWRSACYRGLPYVSYMAQQAGTKIRLLSSTVYIPSTILAFKHISQQQLSFLSNSHPLRWVR